MFFLLVLLSVACATDFDYWRQDDDESIIWFNATSAGTYYITADAGTYAQVPESVFLFFDDFNDGSIDTAKWIDDTDDASESGGLLTLTSPGETGIYSAYAHSLVSIGNYGVVAQGKSVSGDGYIGSDARSSRNGALRLSHYNQYIIYDDVPTGQTFANGDWSSNTYYTWRFERSTTRGLVYRGNSLVGNITKSSGASPFVYLRASNLGQLMVNYTAVYIPIVDGYPDVTVTTKGTNYKVVVSGNAGTLHVPGINLPSGNLRVTDEKLGNDVEVNTSWPLDNGVNDTATTNFNYSYQFDQDGNDFIENITFWVNGSIEQTNSTVVLNNTEATFFKTFTPGTEEDLVWSVQVKVNSTDLYNSTNKTFHFDDVLPIITMTYPSNGTITFTDNITVSGTVTDSNLFALNITVLNSTLDTIENATYYGISSPYVFNENFALTPKPAGLGNYTVVVEASDNHNKISSRSKVKPEQSTSSWDGNSFSISNNVWDLDFELLTDQEIEDFELTWNSDNLTSGWKIKAKCDGCSDGTNYTFKVSAPNIMFIESEYPGHLLVPFNYYADFYGVDYNTIDVDCFSGFCLVEIDADELEWEVQSIGGINVIEEVVSFASDSAPYLSNVSVIPPAPFANEGLNCTFEVEDVDSGDNLRANVTWFKNDVQDTSYDVNGSVCTSGTLCYAVTTVPIDDTSAGDDWQCSVNLYDDYGAVNSSVSDNTTIQAADTSVVFTSPANIVKSQTSSESSTSIATVDVIGLSNVTGCNFSILDADTSLGDYTSFNVSDVFVENGTSFDVLVTFASVPVGAYSADLNVSCYNVLNAVVVTDDLVDGDENDITLTSTSPPTPPPSGGGGGGGDIDLDRISVSKKEFSVGVVIGERSFGNEFDVCSEWGLPVTVSMRGDESWLLPAPSQEFTVDHDQCVKVSFSTAALFTSGEFKGKISVSADGSVDEVVSVVVRVGEGTQADAFFSFLGGDREPSETEGMVLLLLVGLFFVFSQQGKKNSLFGGGKGGSFSPKRSAGEFRFSG